MFYRPHPRVPCPLGVNPSRTKQQYKDECDIHNILRQYQKTGILTHINNQQANYTELPDHITYQESLHILQDAQSSFATLPAAVRDKYNNDPMAFLHAIQDPSQRDYLTSIGVFKAKPAEPPPKPAEPASAPADK